MIVTDILDLCSVDLHLLYIVIDIIIVVVLLVNEALCPRMVLLDGSIIHEDGSIRWFYYYYLLLSFVTLNFG